MTELPLVIGDANCKLYGILRSPANSTRVLILIPALTGTRIGPQNIYVEISRTLASQGIATLCIEFPPSGDSYDYNAREFGYGDIQIFNSYGFYLSMTHDFLKRKYNYLKYYVGSISLGCLPILKYARDNKLSGALLLSPNHMNGQPLSVNKKNLRTYFFKLMRWSTWHKFLRLKINFRKVLSNVISMGAVQKKLENEIVSGEYSEEIPTLCIFGGKDLALGESVKYWEQIIRHENLKRFTIKVVPGSDHSFFGWNFKQSVCGFISEWTDTY
jgi:hypothetical protein